MSYKYGLKWNEKGIIPIIYAGHNLPKDRNNHQIKDTCYRLAKISQNQQLIHILVCNSAKRPSLLAELQPLMSRTILA